MSRVGSDDSSPLLSAKGPEQDKLGELGRWVQVAGSSRRCALERSQGRPALGCRVAVVSVASGLCWQYGRLLVGSLLRLVRSLILGLGLLCCGAGA